MVTQQSITKPQIVEAMQALPEDAGIEEAFEALERLQLLEAIREGEAQADKGLLIPHEEVKKSIREWLR